MPITNEVLDQILKDYEKPEDLLSDNEPVNNFV